jgi:hypothetical protein
MCDVGGYVAGHDCDVGNGVAMCDVATYCDVESVVAICDIVGLCDVGVNVAKRWYCDVGADVAPCDVVRGSATSQTTSHKVWSKCDVADCWPEFVSKTSFPVSVWSNTFTQPSNGHFKPKQTIIS